MDTAALPRILLVGKPNSGKSLLFNRLTGLRQKVANFPGVTVDVKRARAGGYEFVDLPGLYSFDPVSIDEQVAVDQFKAAVSAPGRAVVLCVMDATRLERSLILALEASEAAIASGVPCVIALNMADELRANGLEIDVKGLAEVLGHPIALISARTREGFDELSAHIARAAKAEAHDANVVALRAGGDVPARARQIAQRFAPSSRSLLARQTRIDHLTLHRFLGVVLFLVVMATVFQAIFTWASPLMDATEAALKWAGETLARQAPIPAVGDFIKDGLLGGISAVIVFVPQIFMLTFLIGVLEDSGYLARAAMLCHRPLSLVGLSGKSFVPLLSGHACAIPAIMAARTIESPRARWLTWMAIPLMSCSARLPVYGILIAAVIPRTTYLGGIVGLQGLTLLGLYLLGIGGGLLASALVNRFATRRAPKATPFVLELPPYRMPSWRPLLLRASQSAIAFVKRAGPIIFAVSIVVWVLGYFPGGDGKLESSYLSTIGRFIAPIFAPIALDWKFAVAVLTSFLAREVFVGTLGVLLGLQDSSEHLGEMATRVQAAGLSLASGLALMVFFAISLQCVSTLAVLRKESGSRRLPMLMLASYSLAAYAFATIVYAVFS